MLTRTKSSPISMTLWNRLGTIFMRRVPMRKTMIRTTVASIWIRLIRVIAKNVPSNRIGFGKNSSMDGGWNSPSDEDALAMKVAA